MPVPRRGRERRRGRVCLGALVKKTRRKEEKKRKEKKNSASASQSLSLSEPPLQRITIEKKKNQPAPLSSSKQKEKTAATMEGVFPDALTPLVEADPEVFGILEDEKKRQW